MRPAFEKPSLLQRMIPLFRGFDGPLLLAVLILAALGLTTMYSAGFDHGTRFVDHARNMLLAAGILFVVAQIPPQRLMALAVPLGWPYGLIRRSFRWRSPWWLNWLPGPKRPCPRCLICWRG